MKGGRGLGGRHDQVLPAFDIAIYGVRWRKVKTKLFVCWLVCFLNHTNNKQNVLSKFRVSYRIPRRADPDDTRHVREGLSVSSPA